MTFRFPPLNIPAGLRIGAVFVVNPKKSGKTTVTRICANEFSEAGFILRMLHHDKYDCLNCYGETTQIDLAKSSQILSGKNLTDLTNHTPLSDALLSLSSASNEMVLLDCSGPGSERISSILAAGRFNKALFDRGIAILFLVPLRPAEDSAQGALGMVEELQQVMPNHFVVPVPICDPDDLALLPRDHPLLKTVKTARHGVIQLPALAAEIAAGLERLKRPLSEIADPDSEEALAYIMQASGHDRLVSGMIAEGAQQLILAFEQGIGPLALAPAE